MVVYVFWTFEVLESRVREFSDTIKVFEYTFKCICMQDVRPRDFVSGLTFAQHHCTVDSISINADSACRLVNAHDVMEIGLG